jgi:L-aminopeptidase/D-esterase-like protein
MTDGRERKCNDLLELHPQTRLPGRALRYDFPAVRFASAEYEQGQTGCSVLCFPDGAGMALDVRGGSPGITGDYGFCHAICLAGGSLMGLEASAGVAAELFARGGYAHEFWSIPLVSGGIIYDFGPRWGNAVYPDKALGRAAAAAALDAGERGAEQRIPLGPRGAGRSATVGKGLDLGKGERAGQGAAFRQIGELKLLFVTVVNAMGAIVDRNGAVVCGQRSPDGTRESFAASLERSMASGEPKPPTPGNTTLSVLVTNQKLDSSRSLIQLGRAVHSSMARAIVPFHTPDDGDALWCVSTGEIETRLGITHLATLAGELAWDAVLDSFDPD